MENIKKLLDELYVPKTEENIQVLQTTINECKKQDIDGIMMATNICDALDIERRYNRSVIVEFFKENKY